ncbi:MAG: transposase [Brachymonas sp.]|nr:transposase [Brachymonas sp.]
MARGNRRKYTAQTKEEAVGQVIKAGLPLAQVARSYDMPMQTLENWVSKARRGDTPKFVAVVSDQDEEISRLRALCAKLTMERDILKKATAYFAREVL